MDRPRRNPTAQFRPLSVVTTRGGDQSADKVGNGSACDVGATTAIGGRAVTTSGRFIPAIVSVQG
jgi:hypothetical protein